MTDQSPILWLVDPFDSFSVASDPYAPPKASTITQVQTLKTLFGKRKVRPITVLVPDRVSMIGSTEHLLWMEKFREGTLKRLKELANLVEMENLLEPKVLQNKDGSLSSAIEQVNTYAKDCGARAFFLANHAREGVTRLFLGSFAESLLLGSQTPMVLLSPQEVAPKQVKSILFPVDLSKDSEASFQSAVQIASEYNAELKIFYQIPMQLRPATLSDFYGLGAEMESYEQVLEAETRKAREKIEAWARSAKASDVVVTPIIDTQPKSVSQAIVEQTVKVDLTIMASHTGRLAAALLGSYTRQVVRESRSPVWVLPQR